MSLLSVWEKQPHGNFKNDSSTLHKEIYQEGKVIFCGDCYVWPKTPAAQMTPWDSAPEKAYRGSLKLIKTI